MRITGYTLWHFNGVVVEWDQNPLQKLLSNSIIFCENGKNVYFYNHYLYSKFIVDLLLLTLKMCLVVNGVYLYIQFLLYVFAEGVSTPRLFF